MLESVEGHCDLGEQLEPSRLYSILRLDPDAWTNGYQGKAYTWTLNRAARPNWCGRVVIKMRPNDFGLYWSANLTELVVPGGKNGSITRDQSRDGLAMMPGALRALVREHATGAARRMSDAANGHTLSRVDISLTRRAASHIAIDSAWRNFYDNSNTQTRVLYATGCADLISDAEVLRCYSKNDDPRATPTDVPLVRAEHQLRPNSLKKKAYKPLRGITCNPTQEAWDLMASLEQTLSEAVRVSTGATLYAVMHRLTNAGVSLSTSSKLATFDILRNTISTGALRDLGYTDSIRHRYATELNALKLPDLHDLDVKQAQTKLLEGLIHYSAEEAQRDSMA